MLGNLGKVLPYQSDKQEFAWPIALSSGIVL